jgi:hypothetical protein
LPTLTSLFKRQTSQALVLASELPAKFGIDDFASGLLLLGV